MSAAMLYRCYSANEECLYIGVSDNVERRLAEHKSVSEWAWDVVRVETVPYDDRQEALDEEAAAIRRERPRFNLWGRGPRVEWQASDYTEVLMAVCAQEKEFPGDYHRQQHVRRIERMKSEMRRRFPSVYEAIEPYLVVRAAS